jgi:hypothetical protein
MGSMRLEMKRGPSGKGRAKGNAKRAMKGTEETSHRGGDLPGY